MEFKPLTNIDLTILLETFNQSFTGYFVPVHLTKKDLEDKILTESVDLDFSVGAFEDGKLVGFVLHGYDVVKGVKTLYNAGTGILPAFQGQGLTVKMYQYILPKLKAKGIKRCILEVIDKNEMAIKAYEKVGFKVYRIVDCYKGEVSSEPGPNLIEFVELRHSDWDILKSFWDWNPTWQQNITAVIKASDQNRIIEMLLDKKIVGYAVVNPAKSRVLQFAIDKKYRRRRLGRKLFEHLNRICKSELSIINVDQESTGTKEFLTSIGMEPFIQQFEMELIIE
ncbi:MAG: GNAT family N-acetyltransferase [Marinifilaceae bacterium]|jgi:ribosomal protein S18 acetylase RimI-like enzyme